jgi:uncharacterized protein YndB with AHSA1/START domain
VTRWWGEPGVYPTTGWQADVRAGGAWRAEFAGDDDTTFDAGGVYLVVERPATPALGRLVWTWCASWSPEQESTVFMDFAPAAGGTRLALRQEGFALVRGSRRASRRSSS